MNQRNLRLFKEQCRKAGIPIIATLQDIEDAFDCKILDEYGKQIET